MNWNHFLIAGFGEVTRTFVFLSENSFTKVVLFLSRRLTLWKRWWASPCTNSNNTKNFHTGHKYTH